MVIFSGTGLHLDAKTTKLNAKLGLDYFVPLFYVEGVSFVSSFLSFLSYGYKNLALSSCPVIDHLYIYKAGSR